VSNTDLVGILYMSHHIVRLSRQTHGVGKLIPNVLAQNSTRLEIVGFVGHAFVQSPYIASGIRILVVVSNGQLISFLLTISAIELRIRFAICWIHLGFRVSQTAMLGQIPRVLNSVLGVRRLRT